MTHHKGRTSILMAIAAAMVLAVGIDPSSANQFRRINDANVGCSNNLTCDLYISNPRVTLSTFAIRRRAAPQAPTSIVLTTREAFSTASPIIISVDGRVVARVDTDALSYRAAVSEYMLEDEAVVTDVIAAAQTGSQLTVQYRARSGPSQSAFSLAGFGDALVYMDDVQGRTGIDDRLSQIGARDGAGGSDAAGEAASSLDLRDLGQLPVALRERVYSGSVAACAGGGDDLLARVGGVRIAVPDGNLYVLPCTDDNRDNQGFALWSGGSAGFAPVPVPVMTPDGPSARMTAWNASWDEDALVLTGFLRSSSLGDCGVRNRWTLAGDSGGPALVLAEARAKPECDGDLAGGPERWDIIWPPTEGTGDG